MKKALYFDCFSGISGDMTFGALLDLGLDKQKVIDELAKLHVHGYEIKAEKTNRYAITGTDVDVILEEDHHHHHEDAHEDHDHHHHGRNMADIQKIIEDSHISQRAKDISIAVFREIAKAEAKVHGTTEEEVHFHEVGAVDSIVDIVGVAICIDMLEIDEFYCSKLQEGQGFVHCQHGMLPVPVPAVMKMLEDSQLSIASNEINNELITPTGLGIVKVLAGKSEKMPEIKIQKVGYGFGKRDIGRLNGIRLVLGEIDQNAHGNDKYDRDTVSVIEANIDDATGEEMGFLTELLLQQGALDVSYSPIFMKKNRPAYVLSVLATPELEAKLIDSIMTHSSTIGVRVHEARRAKLYREIEERITAHGAIRVKKSFTKDREIEKFIPEYEDCAKIAKEKNIPLRDIFKTV